METNQAAAAPDRAGTPVPQRGRGDTAKGAGPARTLAQLTLTRGVLGLLLLAGLVYANCLGGGFLLDDEDIYINDPSMGRQTVSSAFGRTPPIFLPHHKGFYYYRPITVLAHSWLLRIFGAQPFPLHLFSVAVHAAASVLVFLLLAELAELAIAWLAAALFLVHPLHVEAVAWMAALPEILAGLLILLSLYFLVRVKRSGCGIWPRDLRQASVLVVAAFATALAVLTKETAVIQPLLAVFLVGWAAWPCCLAAGAVLITRYLVLGSASAYLPPRPFWSQVYLMASALLHYGRKTVWPWPLASEYNLRQPAAAWVVAALAAILLAWLAFRRPRARPALLLFFVPLTPAIAASVVLPGFRQAQDRYAYLAVLGFIWLLVLAAGRRPARLAILALLVVWSALSVAATGYWQNPETLWTQTLRVTPASRTAVMALGEWYYSTERFDDAERIYRYGLAFRPNDRDMLTSLDSVLRVGTKARQPEKRAPK